MRRVLRRLLLALAGGYLVFLALGGVLLRGCAEDRAADKLARALDAKVTIGSSSLSVWRGHIVLEDVVVTRERGGKLDLRIDEVDADLAAWGWMAFDRSVDDAVVRGARMTVSARGLAAAAGREREPSDLMIEHLRIEDAEMALMPTALLPGLGRVEVRVASARASNVTVSSAVSWMAGMTALDAGVKLPAGIDVGAAYADGGLVVKGSLFGSAPLAIPLEMPTLDPRAYEVDQLRALAKALLAAGGARLFGAAAKDAVMDGVRDLLFD